MKNAISADAIESLNGVADEVLVIDSGSNDRTEDISRSLGAIWIPVEWKGFAQTKNLGNKHASHPYILSIDADECLSDVLAEFLKNEKKELQGAYDFSRLTNYCGYWIRHSGWYPDRKIRLFPREKASWEGEYVHEKLLLSGELDIRHAEGDLLHYSIISLEDHLSRVNKYASLSASEMKAKGKRFRWTKALLSPFIRFFKMYFLKSGFRDGYMGFQISIISAFAVYLRYAKLRELYEQEKNPTG